jgi:hypothetical protein
MRLSKEAALRLVEGYITIDSTFLRHSTQTHIAILVKRGKMMEFALNAVGSRSKGCGYSRSTIHAERAVLKKVGDVSKFAGASLIVIRLAKGTKEVTNSEPCHACRCHLEKCMRTYGLKCVYYSA